MKRFLCVLLTFMLLTLMLVGCGEATDDGNDNVDDNVADNVEDSEPADIIKVGMVTDSGSIDDKSFNQGTWEGIKQYEDENGTIEIQYLQPEGEEHVDYVNAIRDLVDTGYEVIVTPGYMFETAINEVAQTYPEITFILIDGYPHEEGDYDFVEYDNVVSIFFAEHEAGFLAGVSAAMSSETGKLGFIGGMEIPAVQKFGWGYQAGVEYANANLGTDAEIIEYQYQGTFSDVDAGKQLAAGMYDKGIDVIFHAAGGVGVGVINEAKERAIEGEDVYVIGVDVDQYDDGIYDGENSVILTSAMKRVDTAAYDYIDAILNGNFPGGQIIDLYLDDEGVGLPTENPNMSDEALDTVEEVKQLIIDGEIVVPDDEDTLETFLGGNFTLE